MGQDTDNVATESGAIDDRLRQVFDPEARDSGCQWAANDLFSFRLEPRQCLRVNIGKASRF